VADRSNWNTAIIEEFRANEGRVRAFASQPLLLLTHTGARSGRQRTNPLAYLADGDRFVVFASKGGSPTNPDWLHNLVANPTVTIEVGTESFEVEAEVAEGDERERLWKEQVSRNRNFGDYEARTSRKIPVIVLRRTST
jgi:deazaflavin-dependent oxidoreductase (nitroreductase family)